MKLRHVVAATAAGLLLAGGVAYAQGDDETAPLKQAGATLCGAADLTLTNNTKHAYVWSVRTGANSGEGETTTKDVSVPGGETITFPVRFDEDSYGGSAYVSFGVVAGPEADFYLAFQTVRVDTDCQPNEEPSGDDQGSDDQGSGDQTGGDDNTQGDDTPGTGDQTGGDDQGDDTQDGTTDDNNDPAPIAGDGFTQTGIVPLGAIDTGRA